MTMNFPPETTQAKEKRRQEFVLLRHGRDVIQDWELRERLNHQEKPDESCPIQAAFYRRAGLR
jgi:hypothetical protein